MEPIKHEWARHEDGAIDIFQMDADYHNGPRCLRCNYSFCHHCYRDGYDTPCNEQTETLDFSV